MAQRLAAMLPTVINQIAAPVYDILPSQNHGSRKRLADGLPAIFQTLFRHLKFGLGVQIGFGQIVANLAFHVGSWHHGIDRDRH